MEVHPVGGGSAPLLVLDFDGVICDSVEECWVSSWAAYHELYLGRAPSSPPAGPSSPPAGPPADAQARFRDLRPYVRSGEDFVLIQQLVSRGATADSQAEFDREWERPGAPDRQEFKDLYYQARTALFDRDPEAWLAMNHIFPHVPAALAGLSPRVAPYILSTKKPQFVSEVLRANRLSVAEGHVLYSEREPKLAAVERLMEELAAREAVFVEDQVDALRANRNPRIRTFLATWGYVQEEWLKHPGEGIELLDPEGFGRLLASL